MKLKIDALIHDLPKHDFYSFSLTEALFLNERIIDLTKK